jgi:hypothetical protein
VIGYVVTDFEGHYPVGTVAVVYAHNREQAKRTLRDELRKQGLGKDDPDKWTLSPVTPLPKTPRAVVLLNGDY